MLIDVNQCVHLFQAELLHLISLQYRLPFMVVCIKIALRVADLHFSFIFILLNGGKHTTEVCCEINNLQCTLCSSLGVPYTPGSILVCGEPEGI